MSDDKIPEPEPSTESNAFLREVMAEASRDAHAAATNAGKPTPPPADPDQAAADEAEFQEAMKAFPKEVA